jgi:hypothetical protein
LDSDEVIPDPARFRQAVERAASVEALGLEYPSRWLYAQVSGGRYLEQCGRWWRAAAGYPGPLAVAAGTKLRIARQVDGKLYRVDFRARNTDPWHPPHAPVDEVVPARAGVLHYSWVRTDEEMAEKAQISGHRDDLDWDAQLRTWRRRREHPLLAAACTPLRRREEHGWLRLVRLPTAALTQVGQDG